MNWSTFFALLGRDAHVARRNLFTLLFQTFLQPLLFVFIFGRVMVGSGYMPASYKSLLLPGIMAISMVFTGIWAVAMPLIGEFQFTREIEDRLLAPINNEWLAIEKVVAGTQRVNGRIGFRAIAGNDHALACRQTIGLHDHRERKLGQSAEGRLLRFGSNEASGWNPEPLHELLRIDFARLELGHFLSWADDGEAASAKLIDYAGHQRHLRPNHGKVGMNGFRRGDVIGGG